MLRRIGIIGGIIAAVLIFAPQGKAQVIELACPVGTTSLQALQTTDTTNGQIRQNYCIDKLGNVTQNITGNINNVSASICTINGIQVVGSAPTFTSCWGSSDIGAEINSAASTAIANSQPVNIQIVDGFYNFSTPISITVPSGGLGVAINCPAGQLTTALNYTPATGVAATVNFNAPTQSSSFIWEGCGLTTATSTSSQGLILKTCFQCSVSKFNFNGFNGGGLTITGDGVSKNSLGVRIYDGIIQNFCGTGSYGISIDHTLDFAYNGVQIYSVSACTTSIPMIIDTGAQGLNMGFGTLEGGLHALVIQNTSKGGAYGGAPAAIWMNSMTPDNAQGGDDFLFDSTLGTSDLKFFSWNLWAAVAGRTSGGVITVSTAAGIRINGGSNIHFKGGTLRGNASWGAVINTTGTDISIDDVNIYSNNACGHATCPNIGGIQVTANPVNVRLTNNRSGNVVEGCPNSPCQDYGIDVSAVTSPTILWTGNDLRNNNLGRVRMPAGLAAAGVDAPEYGNLTGIMLNGALIMPENTCTGVSLEAVLCNTSGSLQLNNNNVGNFSVTQTIASGTATMTTAAIAAGACGTTVTVASANVLTTDTISVSFNSAPAGTNAGLTFWPTSGNVNFAYCPGVAETPAAATINWKVTR